MQAEKFFQFMAEYNTAIWPAQVVFYIFSIFFVYTSFKKYKYSNAVNILILTSLWTWNGSVTLLIYFSGFHPQYYLWGPIWIFQGLLICYHGIVQNNITFKIRGDIYSVTGLIFIVYALAIYPLICSWFGHSFPKGPIFGAAPCPTVIFTFSVFLFSENRVKPYLLYFPLLWAFMSLYPIIGMGVYADIGEIIAAVVSFALILKKNKSSSLALCVESTRSEKPK